MPSTTPSSSKTSYPTVYQMILRLLAASRKEAKGEALNEIE